jgi:hypothetical protein
LHFAREGFVVIDLGFDSDHLFLIVAHGKREAEAIGGRHHGRNQCLPPKRRLVSLRVVLESRNHSFPETVEERETSEVHGFCCKEK